MENEEQHNEMDMPRGRIDTNQGMVPSAEYYESYVHKIEDYLKTIDEVIQKTRKFLDDEDVVRDQNFDSFYEYIIDFDKECERTKEVLNKAKEYYQGIWNVAYSCVYGPPADY